nr:EOG090X07PD [Macrothrix elegans]
MGTVTFMWRYQEPRENRMLWIWSHPTCFDQLLEEIQDIFRESTGITVSSNKGKLNRFRLRGPDSIKVITGLLNKENCSRLGGLDLPGYISGLDVRDPRVTISQARAKQPVAVIDSNAVLASSSSSLWDANVRDEITALRKSLTDQELNKRRAQLLVPGSELPVQPEEKPIPILIVTAPNESDRYIPGCDVILPAGWGTAFWLILVYSGGHAGALKDAEWMHFEHGICKDLCLEIDTDGGRADANERKAELMEEYFRKPPKVRTNFIKLASPFPFGIDWNQLVKCWSTETDNAPNFSVLRDKKILINLKRQKPPFSLATSVPSGCLVPVSVHLLKGRPNNFAMICLPDATDNENSELNEPVHKDLAAKERKILRKQHKQDLKDLAKRRKEDRKNQPTESNSELDSSKIVSQHKEKMKQLWIPPPCDLKTSYARPVIGFVNHGDYALSEGKGLARGFIVSDALARSDSLKVLVRDSGSSCYRWANMTID